MEQVARRLKGQADGHQVDDHLLFEGRGAAPEQVPPGPVPGLDGQRGLALFETQGLGRQGHRDLHRLTPVPSRRKGALGHHLALVPLGKGDLDLFQAAAQVSGFNRQAGFGAHHFHGGF